MSKALKGGEVSKDVYQKYRKMLRMNKTTHILKLNPDDLLDLLSSEEGIIDQKDVEHIKAEQTKKGQTAATIVLLDRIWRKRENWFTSFLTVLQNKEYGYIVQQIDPTFFKGKWYFPLDFENQKSNSDTLIFINYTHGVFSL